MVGPGPGHGCRPNDDGSWDWTSTCGSGFTDLGLASVRVFAHASAAIALGVCAALCGPACQAGRATALDAYVVVWAIGRRSPTSEGNVTLCAPHPSHAVGSRRPPGGDRAACVCPVYAVSWSATYRLGFPLALGRDDREG